MKTNMSSNSFWMIRWKLMTEVHMECGIHSIQCSLHCVSLSVIWMEGTYDMPYKNPYFFVTSEPNRMRFWDADN